MQQQQARTGNNDILEFPGGGVGVNASLVFVCMANVTRITINAAGDKATIDHVDGNCGRFGHKKRS